MPENPKDLNKNERNGITMEIGLWSTKTNSKLKRLIDEHATSTRRTEEEIEKDIEHFEEAERENDHEKMESYLKEELGLEEKDLEELEEIKRYVEIVESNKLKELADEEETIERLKEKHELSHEHAENLMHKIRMIKKYVRLKSAEARQKEAELARKAI